MEKQTILVVDDAPENIELLNQILSGTYRIKVALSSEKRLKLLLTPLTCQI